MVLGVIRYCCWGLHKWKILMIRHPREVFIRDRACEFLAFLGMHPGSETAEFYPEMRRHPGVRSASPLSFFHPHTCIPVCADSFAWVRLLSSYVRMRRFLCLGVQGLAKTFRGVFATCTCEGARPPTSSR